MLQLLLLVLLLLTFSMASNAPSIDNDDSEIANIFKFLEKGENEIQLLKEHKSAILFLGNTGSGKSTFVQWIAGDNDNLVSKELGNDTGDFIIEDGNVRIGSSSNSKTLIPELVIDSNTKTAFYDCAGFGDTRHDIAATYFTKKVTDHLDNVKLVLTSSYNSVRTGGHRTDFLKLLEHTSDLIRNIEIFQDSIALAVTKVDNLYNRHGLRPDNNVIASIADFIVERKADLDERLTWSNTTSEERKSIEKAVEIILILLMKKNNSYSRIMIFRRPDNPGPLSKLPLLQKGKKHVKKVLYEELKFTKNGRDFGYTVSDGSKNKINTLAKQINKKVQSEVFKIVEKIQTHYKRLSEEIHQTIGSFVSNKKVEYVYEEKAKTYATKLEMYKRTISRLSKESQNLSKLKDFPIAINSSISLLGMDNCIDNIKNISIHGQYFDFLQIVNGKSLNIDPLPALAEMKSFIFLQHESFVKDISQFAAKIEKSITLQAESIGKLIEKHFKNQTDALESEELPSAFHQGVSMMSNLTKNAKSSESAAAFFGKFQVATSKFESVSKTKIRNHVEVISNHAKLLGVLKILNDGKLNTWSTEWTRPFSKTEKYLSESKIWFEFLNKLYVRLSEYDVLKHRKKYNVLNINDWGSENKPQGIKIDQDNLKQFLVKIDKFLPKSKLKTLEVTETHLRSLNHVLDLTIKSSVQHICLKVDTLLITGFDILFSDFIGVNGNFSYSCGSQLNAVYIFSTNTIFIDRDIQQIGRKMDISIVAPKWHIVGNRKINLDGAAGESYTPNNAEEGRTPGARGNDGLPGRPGGAAGNFLGIAQEMVFAKKLVISVKGGTGGPGQAGGSGKNGYTGQKADISDNFRYDWKYYGAYNGDFLREYRYYGLDGGTGGDGGDGGEGGIGGVEGHARVLEIGNNYSDHPYIEKKNGTEGVPGNGGAGGGGGAHGADMVAYWCTMNNRWCSEVQWGFGGEEWAKYSFYNERGKKLVYRGQSQAGRNGQAGLINRKNATLDPTRKFQNINDVLAIYKENNLRHLIDNFQKRTLLNFLKQLNKNVEIQNSSSTLGLISEFQILEKQFHSLCKFVDFVPFYQSISNRTIEYVKHLKNSISNSEKKALGYLYSAILSRIYTLKTVSESNLIIDLEGYLKIVENNIDDLKNLHEIGKKLNVINKYKEEYKSQFDRRLKEAELFIGEQLVPDIDSVMVQVKHKIDLLIYEVLELEKQANVEKVQLENKKKELENMMTISWLLSGLKITGQVASCFGGYGAVAGSVIDASCQVADSITLNDQKSVKTQTLPPSVLSQIHIAQNTTYELEDKEFFKTKMMLNTVSVEIAGHPETLGGISDKIKDLKSSWESAKNSSDLQKNKELKEELQNELTKKENELIKQELETNKTSKATYVVKNLNNAIKLGTVGVEFYNKYKSDNKKMWAINKAIEAANIKIQKIKKYETQIYEGVLPTLKKMGNDMSRVAHQLRGKSQVALVIKQWQVQRVLRDLRLLMQQFTKGFTVEHDLARCIEKLEETMTTLVNIYDRIQNYEDQQQLAVYIADISSPTAIGIDIKDKTLSHAVTELEAVIRSNMILEQCKTASNALAQRMFPFAHIYFDDIKREPLFQLESGFDDKVREAVGRVEKLQSMLAEHKTAIIEKTDKHLSSGDFNGNFISTKPFYIWENETYGDKISLILSGKKVALKADIFNGISNKDAIKFSRIGINFTSKDSKIASAIGEKLKGFEVIATHLGNSYYRFNDNIYVIHSDLHNIRFHYEKKPSGDPVHSNMVHQKLIAGDSMLSPYAMWEFQLLNTDSKFSFSDLEIYKYKVDLELVGFGTYLTKGIEVSNVNVENYYEVADIVPV